MRKLIAGLIILGAGAIAGIMGLLHFQHDPTLHELLTENRQMRSALANLRHEEQVGYAKVLNQERRGGRLFTQLLLVQTDPADPAKRLAEYTYQVEGDVVHFDAIIVRFDQRLVESGEQKALILWRRVYGDFQKPSEGFPISVPGEIPERYAALLQEVGKKNEGIFWDGIWDLAHNPDALKQYGISATYGNAVYTQMRPGLIYALKSNAGGQVYPEIYPDL